MARTSQVVEPTRFNGYLARLVVARLVALKNRMGAKSDCEALGIIVNKEAKQQGITQKEIGKALDEIEARKR